MTGSRFRTPLVPFSEPQLSRAEESAQTQLEFKGSQTEVSDNLNQVTSLPIAVRIYADVIEPLL